MTTMLVLGRAPIDVRVHVTGASPTAFAIQFWEDEALTVPVDLTGASVSLVIRPDTTAEVIWPATISGQTATWDLTATDTDVSWKSASLTLDIDGVTVGLGVAVVHR